MACTVVLNPGPFLSVPLAGILSDSGEVPLASASQIAGLVGTVESYFCVPAKLQHPNAQVQTFLLKAQGEIQIYWVGVENNACLDM